MKEVRPQPNRWSSVMILLGGGYAMAGGVITLLGWALDLPRLTAWGASNIAMKANSALCAFAAGLSLCLAYFAPGHPWPVRALGSLIALIGGLTLTQYLGNWDFGIDSLLFRESPGAPATSAPGRMGPPASSTFTLLGVTFLLVTGSARARRIASVLSVAALGIPLLALVGYLYQADQLYRIPRLTGIAWQTATMLAAVALGLMVLIQEHGLAAALRAPDAGGAVLRRLILPVILLPVLIGWIRLAGQQAGLYDSAFGTAARTLCEIVILLALVWWTARGLSQAQHKLQTAQARLQTAERKAGEALRQSEEWHRLTVENSPDGIITADEASVITSVNRAAELIFGYTAAEMLGREMTMLMPERMRERHRSGMKHFLISGQRHIPWSGVELPGLRKDGTEVALEISFGVHSKDGRRFFNGTIRDITERKRAEEKVAWLASFPEGNPNPVVEVDLKSGQTVFENSFTTKVFPDLREAGLRHPLFAGLEEAVVPLMADPKRFLRREVTIGGTTYSQTIRYLAPQHHARIYCADITEGKRMEADLKEAHALLKDKARHLESLVEHRTARLQEMVGELEAFSYSMAHDLRGPLRAMQGYAHILEEDYSGQLDPTGRSHVTRIGAAAERLHRLLTDVLAYSRVTREEYSLEPVDLESLVRDIIEQYPSLENASIRLLGELPAVLGHRAALTQVISNLLTNAVKFVATGCAPEVEVSATMEGDFVILSVRDFGIGIAPEHQERIFRMFERIHGGEEYDGTGIGLAIVRRTVERMGGSAGVESQLGQGSRFWIKMKRAEVRAA